MPLAVSDQALGIAPRRDEWPWWWQEKRDLARTAAKLLVDILGNAEDALSGLRRYACGRGRHASKDAQYVDSRAQAVHEFLQAAGKVPESSRTIERALQFLDRYARARGSGRRYCKREHHDVEAGEADV